MNMDRMRRELKNLRRKRDRLVRLIAAAGPRAARHWVEELDRIEKEIAKTQSAE